MAQKCVQKGQLRSGDQAKPAKKQHTNPCADCPWARTALQGWLGSLTMDEWLEAAHGETRLDCHTISNQQCAGGAIYRANVYKSPRDPALLRLPADRQKVFTFGEFRQHHEQKPRRPR